MSKNPDIPETWGIPDDQSNKVKEAQNKKRTGLQVTVPISLARIEVVL